MTRLSSTERRAALVRAALRVIDRDGVHGATTRAIVAEAEMSLASFHYAFRSRDELIRELIAFVVQDEQRVSLEALEPEADIRSAVRAGLQAYFELLRAHPSREQALQELVQYSLRTPGLEGLPQAQYASYLHTARVLLERGADITGVAWSLPIDQLARILIAITDGLTIAWLADRNDLAAGQLMDFAADTIGALAVSISPVTARI
ncbi:MAG: TetR family transcriptional regulator [Actinomycetota bacterium]